MQTATEFGGAFLPVENLGAANANSLWVCNVANSITVGTTAVVFTQLNGATDLLQGNGISISGNTVSFLPNPAANTGLTVTGSGAAINFGGTYGWTGANTFSAALTASLGLAVSGGAFTSRGIADNATATALTLTAGAQIGAPTGGDKGVGTINATGYYLNGAALANSLSANPSASLGLTAVNGVATTFMTSDSAPALNVGISPTWTGSHTFSLGLTANAGATVTGIATINYPGAGSGGALQVVATSSGAGAKITTTNGTGLTVSTTGGIGIAVNLSGLGACLSLSNNTGNAITVTSGTSAFKAITGNSMSLTAPGPGSTPLSVTGVAGTSGIVLTTSGMQVGSPTGGTGGEMGAGKINVSGGFYLNGVALANATSANPTASLGLTAVNGTAQTFMTSDSAPALNQAIAPTWTGAHTFAGALGVTINAPTSGQALTVAGFAGSSALQLTGTGMQVGSPTGGELGAGKINVASGFYVNGVGVTANSPGKYAQAFGDGSSLSYTITHNLNTQDVVASVYSATTPFAEVDCDISHTTANTATLAFATAPTAGQFRVVLHG